MAGMTAAITYRFYSQNETRLLEAISERPQIARETAYYLEEIEKVESIDDFIADDRLVNYAMTAYGLGDMAYAKAYIRKLLEGGTDDPNSLANRLTDSRYRDFVEDFNFVRHGELTTTFERTRSGVVERYQRNSFEVDAGQQNEGARLALYFERRASEIDSPYDILADRALFEAVRVAYDLPFEMALLPIEKQADMITQRLDIDELSDPDKVDEFLQRFSSLWDLANPETAAAPSILPISGTVQSMSANLLSAIQGLKTRP